MKHMEGWMVAAIAVAALLLGVALGGAAMYHRDALLAPLRAEQVTPDDGPAYQIQRTGLQQEPCRWWLGFTC